MKTMVKNCLLIDDNNQEDLFPAIEKKARTKGIQLKCHQFNIGSERADLLNEGNIDIAKVVSIFKKEFDGTKLDIICVDYNLEDAHLNGLDVLRKIHTLRSTSIYMLYSSTLDKVAKDIISTYDTDHDTNKLLARVKTLTSARIDEFSPRDRYEDDLIRLLVDNKSPLELVMEEKLLEYGESVFENTFPRFQGRKLKDIAEEIRKSTPLGNEFKNELLDQLIGHMIDVNS